MKLFLIALLIPFFSLGQTGTISGNAFYKYNDYVGNRADAASKIYVINKANKVVYTASASLDGNFKIENVDTGYYTIMIVSKNTNTDPEKFIDNFSMIKAFLKINYDANLYDSIKFYKTKLDSLKPIKELDSYSISNLPKKERKKAEDANTIIAQAKRTTHSNYIDKVNAFLSDAYKKNELMLYTGFLGTYNLPKIDFSFKNIENNKTVNIVADFGTTYF